MILTQEDIQHFQKIVFLPCDDAEVDRLSEQQKEALRVCLAQKIAYETVYKKSFPQDLVQIPQNYYHAPSCLAYVCCCLYPQQYKSTFQISASLFRKRFLGTFKFWREDFLQITDEEKEQPQLIQKQPHLIEKPAELNDKQPENNQTLPANETKQQAVARQPSIKDELITDDKPKKGPDLYGPLWLTITYIILLALCANLNDYFSFGSKADYVFRKDYLSSALALTFFVRLAQTIIYPAIMGCLDGEMSNTESAYLVGYSLSLYFLPTILCITASKVIHTVVLLLAAVLRGVFLSRNYTSRVIDRKGIGYMVIFGVQALYYFVASTTFFSNSKDAVITTTPKTAHFLRVFSDVVTL